MLSHQALDMRDVWKVPNTDPIFRDSDRDGGDQCPDSEKEKWECFCKDSHCRLMILSFRDAIGVFVVEALIQLMCRVIWHVEQGDLLRRHRGLGQTYTKSQTK